MLDNRCYSAILRGNFSGSNWGECDLFALRVPHYEYHCQTLGQGWEQTYKLDYAGPSTVLIFN